MAFLDWLLLAGGAGTAYYLLRPSKKVDNVQELLEYKDVSPEGVIELANYKYRLVLEIEPVNMVLRSFEEQSAIWMGFKNLINSITTPTTLLIQTRYLNLKNYLDELERFNSNRPKHIKNLAMDHIQHLTKKTEGKHLRDRRYFIILKLDGTTTGIESGVRIENQLIDAALKSLPKKTNLSTKEIRKNAKDELLEAASFIANMLDAIEINVMQLNRKTVLEMIYQTFNRDLAPFARLEEADALGMFSLFVESKTPDIVLEKGVDNSVQAI